jgi:hypothetical protein
MNKNLIELITDTVSKRPEVHTETIYNACDSAGYVRGTYTSYLSLMKKAGYIRRVKPQVYAIGKPASTQTIALNLQRLALHKRDIKGVLPQNAPVENKQVKKTTSLFTEPKTPFADIHRARKITEAVDLLKSYGIKVTLEF